MTMHQIWWLKLYPKRRSFAAGRLQEWWNSPYELEGEFVGYKSNPYGFILKGDSKYRAYILGWNDGLIWEDRRLLKSGSTKQFCLRRKWKKSLRPAQSRRPKWKKWTSHLGRLKAAGLSWKPPALSRRSAKTKFFKGRPFRPAYPEYILLLGFSPFDEQERKTHCTPWQTLLGLERDLVEKTLLWIHRFVVWLRDSLVLSSEDCVCKSLLI